MEIEYPKTPICVEFFDVSVGCVFRYKDEYYIKIHKNDQTQALSLRNYGTYCMLDDDMVEPYPSSKLTIEK